MSHAGKLRAWIDPAGDGQFLAAFVSVAAIPGGRPATRLCASHIQAKLLIEDLAKAINFEVEWVQQSVNHIRSIPDLAPPPPCAKLRP